MSRNTFSKKHLCMSTALLMLAAAPTAVSAQDMSGEEVATPGAAADVVTVTGSRIRKANVVSVSPVTTVQQEEFLARGVVRTEDLINDLPQVFAAQGSNASNEATGTAQVDLRGLSPKRTLVLLNGRRLPYGSPQSIPSDLNQIPSALIQNVEVLTGGASAVYGSDAIAGVVNFKLIDNFDGMRLTTSLGFSQHNNSDDSIQDLLAQNNALRPGQFEAPEDNVTDGFTQDYSLVVGTNFDDDRGNVTAYATYRNVEPVLQADRDYSACALGADNTGQNYTCGGSSANKPANLANTGGLAGVPTSFRVDNGTFKEGFQFFNFAPFNYYQRPDERFTMGAFANYDINRHFQPYVELSFMDDQSTAQIAPGTIFSAGIVDGQGGLNCDNALLSAEQQQFLCDNAGLSTGSNYDSQGFYLGPDAVAEGILLNRRNVEGGTRQDSLGLTTYRYVGGIRGELAGPFNYDFSASYSNVELNTAFRGDASSARVANALNVVIDRRMDSAGNPLNPETFGTPICAVNADLTALNDAPDCSPLDYFSGAGASDAAVDYISEFKTLTGETGLTNLIFVVDGDLTEYGVKSPLADTGVAMAVGAEYRENTLSVNPDEIYQQPGGGQQLPISGSTKVYEVFGEVNVPLVENRPGVESLAFEGAYRYSDYSIGVSTDTYKLGLSYTPVNDVRLRASYQRAVRAPNVIELFTAQTQFEAELVQNANGLFDPCAGDFDPNTSTPEPSASFEQCANTGVTQAQYGSIIDNPAGQFNAIIGGNPDLEPEKADTFALGAVIQPSFLQGLTMSIDYFNIEVEDLIGTINPVLSMTNCLETGDPFFCDLINRGAGGTLYLSDDGNFVRTNINTGSLKTSGVDLAVDYGFDLADIGAPVGGDLAFNLVGTYLDSYETKPLPNSPDSDIYECSGLYAGLCGRPRPEWRHKLTTTWNTDWDLTLSGAWRYTSTVEIAQSSSQASLNGSFAAINKELKGQHYFDLSASYRFNDGVTLRGGVNNVFDNDPPLTTVAAIEDGGNGNTYPQFYDALGRYFFVGATLDF